MNELFYKHLTNPKTSFDKNPKSHMVTETNVMDADTSMLGRQARMLQLGYRISKGGSTHC